MGIKEFKERIKAKKKEPEGQFPALERFNSIMIEMKKIQYDFQREKGYNKEKNYKISNAQSKLLSIVNKYINEAINEVDARTQAERLLVDLKQEIEFPTKKQEDEQERY